MGLWQLVRQVEAAILCVYSENRVEVIVRLIYL